MHDPPARGRTHLRHRRHDVAQRDAATRSTRAPTGTVRGEALTSRCALRQGGQKRVYCARLGSCVRQDGKSASLTAPNGVGPESACCKAALADAGVQASEVAAIEAHGTGTALGDPIEVRSCVSSAS